MAGGRRRGNDVGGYGEDDVVWPDPRRRLVPHLAVCRMGRAEPKAKRNPFTFSTSRHQTSSRWVSRRGCAQKCAASPLDPSYQAPAGDSPDEAALAVAPPAAARISRADSTLIP